MIIFLILLILLFIINMKINFKSFNKDYLSKNNTTIINGIFVIIVFFSHFFGYNNDLNGWDEPLKFITTKLSQLMVTTFLFYSGYGIYEKIKLNKDKYISDFPKKRLLTTFVNFVFIVLLFGILALFLDKTYSLKTVLLSLIGLESLGNSNWYMFAIFSLYIMVIFSFKMFKCDNKVHLIIITILTLIYIYFMNIYKSYYWCDTVLCFVAGMWYSYYKDKIDNFIMNNHKSYFGTLIILVLLFRILYHQGSNIYIYNLLSIVFVVIINLILMKITSTNKILLFFGVNVFWIYILQRIPMMLLQGEFNIYLYFILSFMITILLSMLIKYLISKFWKKLKI